VDIDPSKKSKKRLNLRKLECAEQTEQDHLIIGQGGATKCGKGANRMLLYFCLWQAPDKFSQEHWQRVDLNLLRGIY
jgi:hypothetical protein